MKLLFAFVLSFILVGCGGGGIPDTPMQREAQASPAYVSPPGPSAFTVAAYGDSTQVGYTLTPSGYIVSVNNPPAQAEYNIESWTGENMTVVNEGRGGTNSLMLLTGTDGINGQVAHWIWEREMGRSLASVVSIRHGINDNGRTTADFKNTIRTLTLTAQNYNKVVVLETPNPIIAGQPLTVNRPVAEHDARAEAIREVAAETGAILCDQHKMIVDGGYASLTYIPDGVHPSETLLAVMGWKLGHCILWYALSR